MKPLFYGDTVNTSRILLTPSDFQKKSLLYIQEIGSLQATKPHTSRRENLSSYLFILVHSGSGILNYDGVTYELKSGSCVFIDCRRPYFHETSKDLWTLSWIHFNGIAMPEIYRKYAERGVPVFSSSHPEGYSSAFSDLYEIASASSQTSDIEVNTALSRLLTLLLSEARATGESSPGTKRTGMLEIKKYLEENYTKKITLDSLSERYFINKFYLTRVFKEQFGTSIMDYLQGVRITKAKELLRFTDRNAEQIGQECGIGDIYYFSRVFKSVEGISIREYRQQWK